jgi:WxcM-like, C-terminal
MMNRYPTVDDCITIQLPKIPDVRGNLSYIEGSTHIPFPIRRLYWIYDVPGGDTRGGHAYRELQEVIIALSGSFDVYLSDGENRRTVTLNRSYYGVYVPRMMWRQLGNFSTNAVCLILASGPYDESDYIRKFDEFQQARVPA